MSIRLGRNWWIVGAALLVLAVIAYAWIDGGETPVRVIAEPVGVPEMPE